MKKTNILVGLLLTYLAACGSPGSNLPPIPENASSTYRFGAGDQVRLITFDEPRLSGDFRVTDTGYLSLPLIGSVRAEGRTPEELQTGIVQAMRTANLFQRPSVAVEVVNYRPIFVLGQVSHPGQFPYQPGMTVLTAVAVAGGFTYRAVEDTVSITRKEGDTAHEGRATRSTTVLPGDVINVFERRF